MRLGVMIGAERGDMARKVKKFLEDIEWAESAGFDTAWMPQVPNDFDALTMVSLMGNRTSRIELGTAVVPLQAQHPVALARQALSVHAGAGGRLALGVGPSHHWIVRDMLGVPYEKPAAYTRDYLEVLNAALAGPGDVDVENDNFTVHNPTVLGADSPMPVLVAALGPVMLQIAGELTDGTVLWMADERAIGDHIAPKITKAAENAGRKAPRIVAGIPVCLCANTEIEVAKAEQELVAIDRAMRALNDRPPVLADELKSEAGAFLVLSRNGEPTLVPQFYTETEVITDDEGVVENVGPAPVIDLVAEIDVGAARRIDADRLGPGDQPHEIEEVAAFLHQRAVGVGHPFDRGDAGAVHVLHQNGAAFHCQTVHMNDASAALAGVAAHMRAGQAQCVAQERRQERAPLGLARHGPAVHGQCYLGHEILPWMAA